MEKSRVVQAPDISGRAFDTLAETVSALFAALEQHVPGAAVFVTQSRSGDLNQRVPGAAGVQNSFQMSPRQGFVSIPLELADGTQVGALCAVRHNARGFEQADLQILSTMARLIAYEMDQERGERERVRQTARLEEQRDQLAKVSDDLAAIGRCMAELGGADARRAVCRTACEVSGATSAQLLEPDGDGNLVSTAQFGFDMPATKTAIGGEASAAAAAFLSRQGYFVADASSHAGVSGPLVDASGAQSILFEPVNLGEDPAGVLAIVWTRTVNAISRRDAAMLRMVANQAGLAIERRRLAHELADAKGSDPLTGLPTEVMWKQSLAAELVEMSEQGVDAEPLTVALMEIDALADVRGRLGDRAADRVVKQCVAAWQNRLRDTDSLARIGNQPFVATLRGCPLDNAPMVVDRLVRDLPDGQVARTGVACWDGVETVEALFNRAIRQLEEACGRERAAPADEPA